MNQYELYEHKKSDTVKWIIAFALIAVLLVGMVAVLFVNFGEQTEQPAEDTAAENTEALAASAFKTDIPASNNGIMLLSTAPMLRAASNCVEQTLTAVVTPDAAEDKSVDWSIAWKNADSARADENVTDYVTVTPKSDGSNVATVACYKAFAGDQIIITATTRVGGFKAICTVSYEGKPTTLTINATGGKNTTDSAWGVSLYEINCGSTYTWNLELDNIFSSVGSGYGDYEVTLTPYGSIDVLTTTYDSSGTKTGSSTTAYELKMAAPTGDGPYTYFAQSGGMHIYLAADIVDGKLVIEAREAPESYYAQAGGRTGSATYEFDGFTNNKEPYTKITVKDTVSGLSHSINIRTVASVTGISFTDTDISF